MKKRYIFSVVTARASAPEQRQILDGIISQAFKMNIDIAVFSNIYNASEYNSFISNENSIYDMVKSDRHDGIIFTDDSFMYPALRDKVISMMNLSGKPVVSIGSGTPQYLSVNNDTAGDIQKITDHLIEVHGFTDIDMLTGPEENSESHKRIEGFKKSLLNHKIKSGSIIYGDFWTASGERLAMDYIESKRKFPQAVVCANDYMAYSLCDTLISHGIKIPDEITVTGYEYIGDRTEHYPVLTTYHRNREALGKQAVIMLFDKICGTVSEYDKTAEGSMISGDSCSCGTNHRQIAFEVSEKKKQLYYASLNDTGMLEQFLTKSRSVTDLISALNRHSYFIPDLSGLYLCLYDDWCVSSDNEIKKSSESEDTVCYTIADIYRETAVPVHFNRNEIFPLEIQNADIPNAYYCCPVFFMNEDFGYMIVRYDKVNCFGESFRNWNKIVSNALEFLRMKNDINYLMHCQNLSEFRDSFTGMNNYKGFVNEVNIAFRNTDLNAYIIYMIRLNIALEIFPADTEKYNLIISGVSELIKKISAVHGRICGRLDYNTFVISEIADENCETAEMIREKISAELYGFFRKNNIYGADFYFTYITEGSISEADFSEKIKSVERILKNMQEENNLKNSSSEYAGYRKLRTSIYFAPQKNITAEDACRKFCLSSGYFRVMYKKYFDISFHQDCIALKTLLAKYYLISTKMNIAAVAEKCSFENEKYFMQQFKKNTGYTPNSYRDKFSG